MALSICSDGHDEICYNFLGCPVCELRDEMQAEIDKLLAKVERLETKEAE